jgi:hypothetical protein
MSNTTKQMFHIDGFGEFARLHLMLNTSHHSSFCTVHPLRAGGGRGDHTLHTNLGKNEIKMKTDATALQHSYSSGFTLADAVQLCNEIWTIQSCIGLCCGA